MSDVALNTIIYVASSSIFSGLTTFAISYFTLIRRTDKLDIQIENLEKKIDSVESIKSEEIFAKLETRLDYIEKQLDKIILK